MTDNSLMSLSSDNAIFLPQVGYSSRIDIDSIDEHSRSLHGSNRQIFFQSLNLYDRVRPLSSNYSDEQYPS